MKPKLKRRPPPPRFRVNVDAKDADGKPRKRVPLVVISRRGVRKRILNLATQIRIAREKQALRGRNNKNARIEEGLALSYLRDVPSVFEIASDLETQARSVPKLEAPHGIPRKTLMTLMPQI